MNICILSEFSISNYVEGTNRITFEIAKTLKERGHDVVILSPNWNRDAKQEHSINGVRVFLFNAWFVNNPIFRFFFYVSNALKLHSKHNFDVFFGLYTIPPALATIVSGTLTGKKKVPTIWEPSACKRAASIPFMSSLFNRSDGILTMTESVKTLISRDVGVPEKLITTIPGFYDADIYHPGEKDLHLVDEYGLDGKFVILFVGRISTLKGAPYLIEATSGLKDTKLLLVGREVEHESFRTLVKQLGCEDSVVFVGYKTHKDLPKFYQTCDCFALPSLNEGFALVVAEAMACGKPVIVSDAVPLPEVADGAGIVVPQRDAGKLKEAILAMRNIKVRRAYSKAAQERATIFDKEKVMGQYALFFEQLVQK